jgi:hypothetical protein
MVRKTGKLATFLLPGTSADDENRTSERFAGVNHINFGPQYENYVVLPIIPQVNST